MALSNLSEKTFEENSLSATRQYLQDEKESSVIYEIFAEKAGNQLSNVTEILNCENIEGGLYTDGSRTPPKSNGTLISSFISSATTTGLMPVESFKEDLIKCRRVVYDSSIENEKVIDNSMKDLEIVGQIDAAASFPNINHYSDGAIAYYPKAIREMALRTSEPREYDMCKSSNIERLINLIVSQKLVGITKNTNSRSSQKLIEPVLIGVKYMEHLELCNLILKPGDLFKEETFKFNTDLYSSGLSHCSLEFLSSLKKLHQVSLSIATYTFKPLNGSQVLRFQIYQNPEEISFDNLYTALAHLNFEKDYEKSILPWGQMISDLRAVDAAKLEKNIWDANQMKEEIYETNLNLPYLTRPVERVYRGGK